MTAITAAGPRPGARRPWAVAVMLLAVVVGPVACSSSGDGGPRVTGFPDPSDTRDPWTTEIASDPVLDDDSDEIAEALGEEGATALLYDYGVPIYEATADTRSVVVTCTQDDWGTCPVEGEPVPMPSEALASSGSDGALVVIDREAGRVYDFWQAEQEGDGRWSVSWGTYAAYDGGVITGASGGSTGAGINLLAGVVRTEEIRAGEIDHALAFASDLSCPGEFRYPATKTDGHATSKPCIPQGARLQLDPSIDVTAIPGITPGEIAIARALQTYGGYLRDSAQSALAVAFEVPDEGDSSYADAGLLWDFYDMPHIPWESLQVLEKWDGR